MIGLPGEVIERVAPTGRVRIGGVLWNARSVTPLEIGTDVEIVAVDGLTVEVRPRRKEASS
jgi:membrane protein implicated in regulation of membrane protease activity